LFFGLSDDPRSTERLRRLLSDESVMTRSRAVRFYAARIHPNCRKGDAWGIRQPADSVPEGIDAVFPLVADSSVKVGLDAIAALSAYAATDHSGVVDALRRAAADPRHKIQHAAARALGIACRGCRGAGRPKGTGK
jgi:hypothetical protein